jgi:hypothetical protein
VATLRTSGRTRHVLQLKFLDFNTSAATIGRMLANARSNIDGQRKRRRGVGSGIRSSSPVGTLADWRDPPPGCLAGSPILGYGRPSYRVRSANDR